MGKQISGRDRAKFDKVWALYRGTRYAGERNNAYTQAYRIAKKYGQTPESFAGASSPPPEPPRSRQNGRADSGHNHHQQQRGKAHAGANSRESGPSGKQTWQAQAERPRSRQEQQRQEQWRGRQREKAQQEQRQREQPPPHRPRYHFETEAEYQFRIWQEDHPFARGDTMWRKWAELWPPIPPLRGRPSTAKRETTPDSGLDVAAVLVMGAIVAMFLSVVVLAALGGWLGVKQFIFVAVLLAGAGVLLVNMVME